MKLSGPVVGPPIFDKPGVPSNIFNAFEHLGEMSETDRKAWQQQATETPHVDAQLGEREITLDYEHVGRLRYPGVVDLNTKIEGQRVLKFSFGDLRVRNMSDDMRLAIVRGLDEIKQRAWQDYHMKIRRAFIITELYYGKATISLDLQARTEVDIQVLEAAGFEFSSKNTLLRKEVFKMKDSEAPFAMQTAAVRHIAP